MMEDLVMMKEIQLELSSTEVNKNELREAENDLIKLYKVEEEYWKQKTGMA